MGGIQREETRAMLHSTLIGSKEKVTLPEQISGHTF